MQRPAAPARPARLPPMAERLRRRQPRLAARKGDAPVVADAQRTRPQQPAREVPPSAAVGVERRKVLTADAAAASAPRVEVVAGALKLVEEVCEALVAAEPRQREAEQDDAGGPAVEAVGVVARPEHGAERLRKERLGQVGAVGGQDVLGEGWGDVREGMG
jgi:hypothetical protein